MLGVVDHYDPVPSDEVWPAGFHAPVVDDPAKRLVVVELEPDVVCEAAAEVGDPPEEPVCGAVGRPERCR